MRNREAIGARIAPNAGENHPFAKLTNEAVTEILAPRGRAPLGFYKAMARKHHVSPDTIEEVRKRRTWKHIKVR